MSESIGNATKIRMLEKRREAEKRALEEKKKQISQGSASVGTIGTKFASRQDFKEEKLKKATFGLVTHEEFIAKQESVEVGEELTSHKKKTPAKSKKRKVIPKKILSFHDEEEEEILPVRKKMKIGKNPSVDTSFLPDRERDAQEKEERIRLKKEWLRQQAAMKQEPISITYSYWDGCGHRRCLTVTKGTTIDRFLVSVREEFNELRAVSIENLLFIKEDLIIPHHYTFYDLIVTKARGKSGPLFSWDVYDDVRLLADATKEKDESHAAKVVERNWYERNKHIFPANRWEIYDPAIDYGTYTRKDSNPKAFIDWLATTEQANAYFATKYICSGGTKAVG